MGAGLTNEWEPIAARIADPALSACAAIVLVIFNYPFSKCENKIQKSNTRLWKKNAIIIVNVTLSVYNLRALVILYLCDNYSQTFRSLFIPIDENNNHNFIKLYRYNKRYLQLLK